jgi:hypothetical protein
VLDLAVVGISAASSVGSTALQRFAPAVCIGLHPPGILKLPACLMLVADAPRRPRQAAVSGKEAGRLS